ncbi:MAG: PTS sugar transporter subunit IIA [Spirochaetaceae bacterium]|jgi:PTS system nitrogen regulatory IIA component|nr:PTS sugar transporter subunit IIA [Spirochaetaceae bacterium]
MKESMAEKPGLITLLRKGGLFPAVPGANQRDVLSCLIRNGPLAASLNEEDLLKALLEREALMSTAIGNGIALPHPRNPILLQIEESCVLTGYLQQPVDWKAPDGVGVHTILLVASASPKSHLHTLSKLIFFCQQEPFYRRLQNRASLDEIITVIQDLEQTW